MIENRPDYLRIVNDSEILLEKERKNSGLNQNFNSKKKPKPEIPDSEDISPELREAGQKLQDRSKKLMQLYKDLHHFDEKKLTADSTIDYLVVRLEPSSPEYILAHLKELDALTTRAEFEPRLLPLATAAVETWEKLAGALPTSLIEDGLRVDSYSITDLKNCIANFKLISEDSSYRDSVNSVLKRLREKNPELIKLIEAEIES